jgi:glycerol-3-phosphate cytidylyltransferase
MENKRYKVGYTQGVFDMFHIGHLNLINNAKKYCDILIVGVNSDNLVQEYKNITPTITQENRLAIVKNIKAVDDAIIVDTLDKNKIHKDLKFDAIFIGDDWQGNERWLKTEIELEKVGTKVVYLSYTDGISSTILRKKIKD